MNSKRGIMALTCPRCGTDVSVEALYCPYCNLPKPRGGFAFAAEEKPIATAPQQPAAAYKPAAASKKERRASNRSFDRPPKTRRQIKLGVLGLAALMAVLSVGIYVFVVPLVLSQEAEPKAALSALEKLRHLPSNQPGVTIGDRMSHELETSRKLGNLAAYKGWTVRPIKGTKTKVLISFSYREVDGAEQKAEWIADLATGSFAPQTPLAVSVSSR
jgi:hypothetical protein